MEKFGTIEERTYREYIPALQSMPGEFKVLGDALAAHVDEYDQPWKEFIA